jgi:hypothetical protein
MITKDQLIKNAKFHKVRQLTDAIYRIMREKRQTPKQAVELQMLVAQRKELMGTMPLTVVK